jgi:pimeloyl-ACP methyl ester carboxylesterase
MHGGVGLYWALFRLALVLAGGGAIVVCLTLYLMAMALLRPPRMGPGKAMFFLRRLSPEDLNLPYELIHFSVKDRRSGRPIRLAAWWIGQSSGDRCAILLHGYTDAKVGAIAWAPLLRSLGYAVLAIDLRAHGDSEGEYSTAGFDERYDMVQVIDQLRKSYPSQTRQIVLIGLSMGAAVAAATALLRDDLAAVILDSPYLDFPSAVLSHADKLGVPGRMFQRAALWLCQIIAGIDYRQVRPVDMIPRLTCPLWVIQPENDPFTSPRDHRAIAAAVAARAGLRRIWEVADCHHIIAMAEHPQEYRRRLEEFLAEALAQSPVKEVCPP